jgi:hypothetical protein
MTLQKRLERMLEAGNLTVADLARWFDRPHATVRGWVKGGRLGLTARLDAIYVETQLRNLERRLETKAGLPVPRMPSRQRIGYLSKLKNGRSL